MDRKQEQLGMPYGTASNRLVKKLLFWMAQQLEMNYCYQCKWEIEGVEDFSIEHKKPWLDVSSDLFWDLDNIAFSHRGCNYKAKRKNTPALLATYKKQMKCQDPNKAWCGGCKVCKDKSEFCKDKHRRNGLNGYCKFCMNVLGKGRGPSKIPKYKNNEEDFRKKISDGSIESINRLYKQGEKIKNIAAIYNVTRQNIWYIIKGKSRKNSLLVQQ